MQSDLILLTGSTGHVGFATLIAALQAGYSVRASVRRESSIADLKATTSIQPYLSQLSFVVVPDITISGAFDSAVKGVTSIIHIASPLPSPSPDLEATIIQPAILGSLSILESALKEPKIRRIVITSSKAAVTPLSAYTNSSTRIITPQDTISPSTLPKAYPNMFAAYVGSKVLAYNATLSFIESRRPHFSIINVMPSLVIGKNELATTPALVNVGSNAVALKVLLGVQNPAGMTADTVHIDDVAKLHVEALDASIQVGKSGYRNLGANSHGIEGVDWDSAIEIVKKHFPSAVEEGIFPLGGSQKSVHMAFDARETERVFGWEFKSWEEQLLSLAGWYVHVSKGNGKL